MNNNNYILWNGKYYKKEENTLGCLACAFGERYIQCPLIEEEYLLCNDEEDIIFVYIPPILLLLEALGI
jgi:hypothetical protein